MGPGEETCLELEMSPVGTWRANLLGPEITPGN